MTTGDMLSVKEWQDLARSRGKDLREIASAVGSGHDPLGDFSPDVDDIIKQVCKRTNTFILELIGMLGLPRDAKYEDILKAVRALKERAINTPSEI